MNATIPKGVHPSLRTWLIFLVTILILLAALAGAVVTRWLTVPPKDHAIFDGSKHGEGELVDISLKGNVSVASPSAAFLPEEEWGSCGVEVRSATSEPFLKTIRLTGKVSLNEDQIAHIYPMVEGSVERVLFTLGQEVKANDLLAVIHSREVGQAKLELYQARLQHEMAVVKDKLQQEITANAKELLTALRAGKSIAEIEKQFQGRTVGDYRERLLTAYLSFLKSEADVQRLDTATSSGAISAKQLYAAQTSLNADHAVFQARIEQIEFEFSTSLLLSTQAVNEALTKVAVAATNLRILGSEEAEIELIDPMSQGRSISAYSIRAPFDGTVIAKDIALREQVRPNSELLSIVDLSNVWISADIYEQHVPLLSSLTGKQVRVLNEAWPERCFQAKIFYTGEIMEESTRTIAMRAIADNPGHLLKPGMFVTIEIPSASETPVVQVPRTAVQEHNGETFVFVYKGGGEFERRTVQIGDSNEESSVVVAGLSEQDTVASKGGFILKSKMLSELMGEE